MNLLRRNLLICSALAFVGSRLAQEDRPLVISHDQRGPVMPDGDWLWATDVLDSSQGYEFVQLEIEIGGEAR